MSDEPTAEAIAAILLAFAMNEDVESLFIRPRSWSGPLADGEANYIEGMFVNCNDLFWWATADCEPIGLADIADYERAVADLLAAGDYMEVYAAELWCCRKRGMRPQQPVYKARGFNEAATALFDAAGPERDPKDEG